MGGCRFFRVACWTVVDLYIRWMQLYSDFKRRNVEHFDGWLLGWRRMVGIGS